jgi:hypothetical protein
MDKKRSSEPAPLYPAHDDSEAMSGLAASFARELREALALAQRELRREREWHRSEREKQEAVQLRTLEALQRFITALQKAEEEHDRPVKAAALLPRTLGAAARALFGGGSTAALHRALDLPRQAGRALRRRTVALTCVAQTDLRPLTPGAGSRTWNWESIGRDPSFALVPRGAYPTGWVRLRYELRAEAPAMLAPRLYFDPGAGFSETHSLQLPSARDGGPVTTLLLLPDVITGLRFDPTGRPGRFHLGSVSMEEVAHAEAALQLAWPIVARTVGILRGGQDRLHEDAHRADGEADYQEWVERFDTLGDADRQAIRDRVAALAPAPLLSVLMPAYNTPEVYLRRSIESVCAQLYPHWELWPPRARRPWKVPASS